MVNFAFLVRRSWCAVLTAVTMPLLPGLGLAEESSGADDSFPTIAQFFADHCVKCHGEKKKEADLRLDELSADFNQTSVAEKWTEVLDRLNQGDMPPEGEPRPDARRQTEVTTWITEQLRQATDRKFSTGGHVVLRRLNREQFNNTIRDLVGVDFRPAESFPEDPSAFGFDNVGSALTLSPLHIEKYMEAARQIVRRAQLTSVRPTPLKWHFEPEVAAASGKEQRLYKRDARGRQREYARVFAGENEARGDFTVARFTKWNRYVGVRAFNVHRPGRFVVRVRVAGRVPTREQVVEAAMMLHEERITAEARKEQDPDRRNRLLDYWSRSERERMRAHFLTDPMYEYGPPRMRIELNGAVPVAMVDVLATEDQPQILEFPIDLETTKCEIKINNCYHVPKVLENQWHLEDARFPRPELLIDWIEIVGPEYEEWPPRSRQLILRNFSPTDPNRARKVIATFMKRAYRRPPRRDEVDNMMSLYEASRRQSANLESALEVPLVAILTSPKFLFLVEEPREDRRLDDYELASRLSYWLWNTMPDDELFGLAKQGRLTDRTVMLDQIDRMLADEKSEQFVRSFVTQWLEIRDIAAVLPDERLYPRFDEHLLASMTEESVAFFAHLLRNDLSIENVLQSDFAVVNARMARHYGLSHAGIMSDEFRPIDLPSGSRRGGMLTHASIHMVTSNGTRTSPVKRGVWILKNILGDPPPPPPPNAGDIQPGVPGIDKATVRIRLEAHRRNPACASCHDKIDPLGFALENYDAIGRWREREGFGYNGRVRDDDPPIDASGKLPDGQTFHDFDELQQILMTKKEQFFRCFAEKMTIYALGRGLEYTDRPVIDHILSRLPEHRFTVRGVIKDIATSDLFLMK